MGKAKFKLSYYILETLLGLPYEARITDIGLGLNLDDLRGTQSKELVLFVEHPDLPDIDDSSWFLEPVEIFPKWRSFIKQEFVDWGIPK